MISAKEVFEADTNNSSVVENQQQPKKPHKCSVKPSRAAGAATGAVRCEKGLPTGPDISVLPNYSSVAPPRPGPFTSDTEKLPV